MNLSSDNSDVREPGRFQASAAVVARGVDHRAELAGLELCEARHEAVSLAAMFLVGAVAALLTGFALNFFVAAVWWDTPHRMLAIGLTAGVQALAAAVVITMCIRRARVWRPLAATIDQIKKDSQCLRDLLTSSRN